MSREGDGKVTLEERRLAANVKELSYGLLDAFEPERSSGQVEQDPHIRYGRMLLATEAVLTSQDLAKSIGWRGRGVRLSDDLEADERFKRRFKNVLDISPPPDTFYGPAYARILLVASRPDRIFEEEAQPFDRIIHTWQVMHNEINHYLSATLRIGSYPAGMSTQRIERSHGYPPEDLFQYVSFAVSKERLYAHADRMAHATRALSMSLVKLEDDQEPHRLAPTQANAFANYVDALIDSYGGPWTT